MRRKAGRSYRRSAVEAAGWVAWTRARRYPASDGVDSPGSQCRWFTLLSDSSLVGCDHMAFRKLGPGLGELLDLAFLQWRFHASWWCDPGLVCGRMLRSKLRYTPRLLESRLFSSSWGMVKVCSDGSSWMTFVLPADPQVASNFPTLGMAKAEIQKRCTCGTCGNLTKPSALNWKALACLRVRHR